MRRLFQLSLLGVLLHCAGQSNGAEPGAQPHQQLRALDMPTDCTPPVYPELALRERRAGTVQMRFKIDLEGKPVDARIDQSSGHADLDKAALEAYGRCKFVVSERGGGTRRWLRLSHQWKLPYPS